MNYIIGMDIGTTSTKAVLYGEDGQVYTHANKGYPLYRDATGMAEEDQEEILTAVTKALKEVVSQIDFKKDNLKGVSFSSANQSLIALDKDHQPLTRIQTWGDTRSTKYAEQIKNSDRGQAIYEKTGTPIQSHVLIM